MLAVSSPTYAENATEAVSISDTASVVELTTDANMETEMQSVSDSDTTETSAQETDQVALPAIWQETYTYLADTQDAHTFPEQIEKSGTSYQLKDVQYQITELTKISIHTFLTEGDSCGSRRGSRPRNFNPHLPYGR